MLRRSLFICLAFIFCINSPAFAKLIVTTSDHLHILSGGIYADIRGELIPLRSVVEAEDGYFVASPKDSYEDWEDSSEWECQICGATNSINDNWCWKCDNRRR